MEGESEEEGVGSVIISDVWHTPAVACVATQTDVAVYGLQVLINMMHRCDTQVSYGRYRDRDRDEGRDGNGDGDRDGDRDRDINENRNRKSDRDGGRDRDGDRDRDKNGDRDRDGDVGRDRGMVVHIQCLLFVVYLLLGRLILRLPRRRFPILFPQPLLGGCGEGVYHRHANALHRLRTQATLMGPTQQPLWAGTCFTRHGFLVGLSFCGSFFGYWSVE